MNNKYVIINGELLPETSASILVADLSIQRGYGVFDFFITHQSVPIFLADHLNRLYYSAEEMHLEVGYSKEALIELITMLTNANQMADSGIRITITGGYSEESTIYKLFIYNPILKNRRLMMYYIIMMKY
jgi:branched-chain amino acid aminotransferase